MEVELIKANSPEDNQLRSRKINRLRVAAYCRVSTDDEDQIKSYKSMVRYYSDLIHSNKEWDFAGVYADKAITGTKVDKREEFQRLIQDCMDGKIDMILAKSLPRFARNTLDTLKYVRMLREKNIAVYFEVEKINTLKDGEFLMTILSSVAQQEVENTSAYVKKGLKMKMKRGELVGFQGCMGYDYDKETKSISVNEEGAKIVRYIFERYCAGAGGKMISRELNEQGYKTLRGNKWMESTVLDIIKNEKYKGDILLGKTYTVDPISKRRLENLGEEDRYYIRNHHEPIVDEETFAKAQEIRAKRNSNKKHATIGDRPKYSRQYSFSSILECGYCGSSFTRRHWHSGSNYLKINWQCTGMVKKGRDFCPDSKAFPEEVLENAFLESYRILCADSKEVVNQLVKTMEKKLAGNTVHDKIRVLKKEITALEDKRSKLLDNFLDAMIDANVYQEKDVEFKRKLAKKKQELAAYEGQIDEEVNARRRINELKKALEEHSILKEFDREVFESVVEKIIVGGYDEDGNKDPFKLIFVYKAGYENYINQAKNNQNPPPDPPGGGAGVPYSHGGNEVSTMCSPNGYDTCRDGSSSFQGRNIESKGPCGFLTGEPGYDLPSRRSYIRADQGLCA